MLLETMQRFNEACNDISKAAFDLHLANKIDLQKVVYYYIRERYGFSAQMTVRAITKVICLSSSQLAAAGMVTKPT